ncbi:MAG: DUF3987 domain-containing protein [Deltaproteobacteria bacterium]|nr:DUF3987 domain-containing protein [Deltaproteobacteria bacterium]
MTENPSISGPVDDLADLVFTNDEETDVYISPEELTATFAASGSDAGAGGKLDPAVGETAVQKWFDGLKRFPCRARTIDEDHRAKAPLTAHGFKDATNDPAQLEAWTKQYAGCMWGAPTGATNGFWVFDGDVPKLDKKTGKMTADGRETIREFFQAHGLEFPPRTLTIKTPSDGVHYCYEVPAGVEIVTKAGILPGVDIRGDDGYACIPPYTNLDNGKAYKVIFPVLPAETPAPLLELVTKKKEKPAPSLPVAQVAGVTPNGGTAYGRKALEDELAVLKDASKGTRNDTLNEVTIKLAGLAKGGALDGEEVYAAIEAMARETGLSDSEIHKTMASAWKAAMPRNAPAREGTDGGPKPGEEGFEWDEPVLLTDAELPQITRDMLPPVLGDYCAELTEEVQVPFELTVSMVLAVVATAAALIYRVHVRENYFEWLCLYTLCILNASNRKSAVVKAAMKPLIEWEDRQRERLEPEIERRNRIRKALTKRIELKNNEYAKCKNEDRQKILDEIRDLEDEMPPELRVPALWTDSPTPEALSVLMEEQNERMALLSDEAGVFEILAGMYSRGVPNLDLFLKGCFGMPCRIPRKTGTVILKEPLLTVGITAQEVVLTRRSASEVFRGRGGDCRILYFYPASNMGRRNVRDPKPMQEETQSAFHAVINRLLPSEWWADGERPEPINLELSPGALERWIQFSEGVEEALRPGGEFEFMQDWGGKIAGFVVRLAGLFHLVSYDKPWEEKIAPETMEKAIRMGAALSRHAKKAYELMGTDEATNGAKKVLEWIERTGSSRFTFREVWQGTKGFFRHVDKLIPALKELRECFYIYELPSGERTGAGRPARPNYLVNPKALKG